MDWADKIEQLNMEAANKAVEKAVREKNYKLIKKMLENGASN